MRACSAETCSAASASSLPGERPMRTTSASGSRIRPLSAPETTSSLTLDISRLPARSIGAGFDSVHHLLQRVVALDLVLITAFGVLVDDRLQLGCDFLRALGTQVIQGLRGDEAD